MKHIDISRTLVAGFPAWPGDVPYRREVEVESRDGFQLHCSSITLSAHCGTHVDAPLHLRSEGASGPGAEAFDLNVLMGPARVIDLRGSDLILPAAIQSLPDCPARLLLRTDNSSRPYRMQDFVALSAEAAQCLAARACILVGIDGPSIDPEECLDLPAHRTLLGAGVTVVEGLDLARVDPGDYLLTCLPLPLAGSDGAPARAVLSVEE